ncbi:MAG: hypothetical protein HYR74_08990 [Candidatus Eisenbacteria bacterium]|nr:hypothetical protein [Candidatus Eisenbacteria bacterium]
MHDRLSRVVIELIIALVVLSFVIAVVREQSAIAPPRTHVATSMLPHFLLASLVVLFALGIVVRASRAIQAGGRQAQGGRSRRAAEEPRAKRTIADQVPALRPHARSKGPRG